MELQLKIYDSYCETEAFSINGILAEHEDFGEKEDNGQYYENCWCSNMEFKGKPSITEVLNKYKITEGEYQEVVSLLEKGLSFGQCNLCEQVF